MTILFINVSKLCVTSHSTPSHPLHNCSGPWAASPSFNLALIVPSTYLYFYIATRSLYFPAKISFVPGNNFMYLFLQTRTLSSFNYPTRNLRPTPSSFRLQVNVLSLSAQSHPTTPASIRLKPWDRTVFTRVSTRSRCLPYFLHISH